MNVRCTNCRQSFNLSRDYVGMALAKAEGKRLKYHGVECVKCRKIIKVPIAQMLRYAPLSDEEE